MTSDPGALSRKDPDQKIAAWHMGPHGFIENAEWDRHLTEYSRDLLCTHDLGGRLLWVAPSAARLLGYSVDELLHVPMRELVPSEFRSQFDEYLQTIIRDGEARGLLGVVTRSGKQRLWDYHNKLLQEGLAPPVVRGMAHDVTERVNAEKALRATNEKLRRTLSDQELLLRGLQLFRALLDQSNEAIEVVDPETLRLLDVNQKESTELGYSRDELLSMTIFDIDPKITRETVAQTLQALRKSGCLLIESVHHRKDGTIFPVEVNLKIVQLDKEYVVALSRDITERKRTEERLQEYERVLESLDEMIVVLDRERRYVIANRASLRHRGMTREQLVGRHVTEIVQPHLYETTVKAKLDACFAGQIVRYEGRSDYPGLGIRDIACTYLPIESPTGIDRVACVLQDVTERNLRTGRLQEYERVLESLDEMIVVVSRDYRYVLANRAFLRYRGMTKEEVVGRLVTEILQTDAFETTVKKKLEECFGGAIVNYEMKYDYPELGVRDLAVTYLPVEGPSGIDRVACVLQDITEQKRSAAALEESEKRFRAVHERAPVGIALVNSHTGRFLQVNPKFCEIAGRTEAEMLRLGFSDITHPEDLADGLEILRHLIEGHVDLFDVEKRYVRPDGTVVWVSLSVVPMWSSEEAARWHMAIVQDITARKRAEDALRESEERLRLAQEAAQMGTFERNLRTGQSQWSPHMGVLFGLPTSEYPKTIDQFVELIHVDDRKQVKQWIDHSMEFGEAKGEWRVLWPDGSIRWISGRWRVFKDASGKPERVIGMDFDITERKQVEEKLRQAKERLTEEKLYLEQEIDTELGFEDIIGQSKALKAVMESASKVASTDAAVLLLGETGTGKELIARAIHRLSHRAGNSFIKMNCAAIPSGLLESELFGNEKGAFTGAVSKKIGRLELADKGTIFLDEIGEISLALQPKLLRILQDQEFERLGGTQTIQVNFRLIAATNRDLAESVRENEFRSDLYYRLNVFPIRLPPLRKRREDIPLLVEHFVQKCSRRMNKVITSVPRKTMDALVGWNWPGNVRELENFIERSVILTTGSVLAAPLNELQPITEARDEDDTLKAKEREYILRALRDSHGQISGPRGAATRLGLKRTTLQSKLKHLGISPRIPHQGSP